MWGPQVHRELGPTLPVPDHEQLACLLPGGALPPPSPRAPPPEATLTGGRDGSVFSCFCPMLLLPSTRGVFWRAPLERRLRPSTAPACSRPWPPCRHQTAGAWGRRAPTSLWPRSDSQGSSPGAAS